MKLRQKTILEFSEIYNAYNNEKGLKMRQAIKKAIYSLPEYTEVQKSHIWKTVLARADKELRVNIK